MPAAPSSPPSLLLLAALLPLSLTACASGPGDATGSAASVADASRLQYVRLVNDSRCPLDRQCVWAGDAIVALEWTPASGAAESCVNHTRQEPP